MIQIKRTSMNPIIIFLVLLAFSVKNYAQPNVWKKIQFAPAGDFPVESYLEVVDQSSLGESNDTVRADLVVNENAFNSIRFAKPSLKNGEVVVTIYETNEASDHKYVISIYKNKYQIRYNYVASGESEDDGIIVPYETKLILNTSNIRPGAELKGYTELKGKCGSCKEDIKVKGNFTVVLK